MPGLVNGQWVKGNIASGEIRDGAFEREPTRFRHWITPQGESNSEGSAALPAEPERYQLFVAYLCPWASRTLIFRKLKGLEDLIPVSIADAVLGEEGWTYTDPQDAGPRLGGVRRHYQLYTASEPYYTGKVSVPVLWDRAQGQIVNNESADIIRIFNSAFDHLTGNELDFYPAPLRKKIDAWNEFIYEKVNNGVYRAGFAKTQASYDSSVVALFEALDQLEERLAKHRYLAGTYLTEADWRLFVTLIRFDAAYHGAFKCNICHLEDYPNLSNYLRELYQWPGVKDTVNLDHIKIGYYTNPAINPALIVPKGPALDFERAHDRGNLQGAGIWRRDHEALREQP
ncbi:MULTISPECIES: glutathione S-transferase family protein [Halomonadaceae]|uniref:glutathione S-transferase family protein n=1 Tax=Halomonadaceae TaxID=28256 RepID=UPI0015987CD7|nr:MULTISPECIES: glutathione S-transferase family protein [Halomonas]QJQ94853.1 glutathione S-transferase family protein [Halomonas sp. PA5]